ncbi:response regulator [Rhizobium sp.]|uniref:response regulator n=1 Tax=Rhizobium sp. TaxID=391 RepID=UPI0028AB8746
MEKIALIVEDELFIVLELEDLLNEAGYDVDSSHPTVSSALVWLETNKPDLAVIDYRLRDATSEVLIVKLIEVGTPTIIYSGNDCPDERSDHRTAQFEWVSKPAPPEIIRAAINRATEKKM